jgi:hypothetical protein
MISQQLTPALQQALRDALLTTIHDENLKRHEANAAEPYVHSVYADHEERIKRLVTALCDGDEELYYRYYEALFDMTLDGVIWQSNVFAQMVHERTEEKSKAYWASNA